MNPFLSRDDLLVAFKALDVELGRLEIVAEIFVVGGAAMALAYSDRRSTMDVDAVFVPTTEVRIAAARVGQDLNLEPDWLNDGVKGFLPRKDENSRVVFEGVNVSVSVASPHYLLATKLMAWRAERDQEDIEALYEICGFTTAAQGIELLSLYYPDSQILPRVGLLLQEMYPPSDG